MIFIYKAKSKIILLLIWSNAIVSTNNVKVAIKALESGGITQRRGAVVALSQTLDERAIKPLVKALQDDDIDISQKAAAALEKFSDKATEHLIGVLTHPNNSVRLKAVEILGKIRDNRAFNPLCKLLCGNIFKNVITKKFFRSSQHKKLKMEDDYMIRSAAVEALQKFGTVAVDPLIQSLKDKDWYVRWKVIQALESIGDIRAIGSLELCKFDESKRVREASVIAIEKLKKVEN